LPQYDAIELCRIEVVSIIDVVAQTHNRDDGFAAREN
jgi:hypothetical protein